MKKIYISVDTHQEFQTQGEQTYTEYVKFLKKVQDFKNELWLKDSNGSIVKIIVNNDLTITKE